MFLGVATYSQRRNFLAIAMRKWRCVLFRAGPKAPSFITLLGGLIVTNKRQRTFKTQFVYIPALTAKMNTSYLFELQQNVVHSSVSITSEQNRFAASHQHTDQAGDGGGLARAWHAQYQCIVVSSQGFGHRLLLPRVQLL